MLFYLNLLGSGGQITILLARVWDGRVRQQLLYLILSKGIYTLIALSIEVIY